MDTLQINKDKVAITYLIYSPRCLQTLSATSGLNSTKALALRRMLNTCDAYPLHSRTIAS